MFDRPLKQGDTFLLEQTGIKKHLYTIISDPIQDPDNLLVVNFTTLTESCCDTACVVEAGCHPFIVDRSYVYYRMARLMPPSYIQRWSKPKDPLSGDLLGLVLEGAEVSDFLPIEYRQILVDQRLII